MRSTILAAILAGVLALAACKAECVGCQPELGAAAAPTSYRFEVEYWEMPLARAESLYRVGDRDASSVALLIDEKGLAKPLRELAARDRSVHHADLPGFSAPAGIRGLAPRSAHADGTWASGLRLELGATPTSGWSPHTLDFACVWTSPQGERLATAQGSTPLAPDHDVIVWCLPARALAEIPEPRTARAIAALVRVVPGG